MIRPYQHSDTDSVLEVWEAAARAAYHFVPEDFWQAERDAIRDIYLPAAQTFVYDWEGRIVGTLSLIGNEIGGLFVRPDAQGKGIGTALVDDAKRRHGSLSLTVFAQNHKARRFYEKCGFAVTGESVHAATGCPLLEMRFGEERPSS